MVPEMVDVYAGAPGGRVAVLSGNEAGVPTI